MAISEIKSSTLNGCWKSIWPECVKCENTGVNPNGADVVLTEIVTLAQTVGGDGFDNLTFDDINEIIIDSVLDVDDLLEVALEDVGVSDNTGESETPPSITASLIIDGLQMANKLAEHFLANDHINERAVKFQSDLQSCMARYKELYKEISKVGSQRSIAEFAVKIIKPVEPENADVLSICSDETNVEPVQRERPCLLSETDTE